MATNPKIFRINSSYHVIKNVTTGEGILRAIVRRYQNRNGIQSSFSADDINYFERGEVKYFLYSYNSDSKVSKWSDFLPDELTNGRNLNEQKVSLILLAKGPINTYVVIGGNAYHAIVPFIDKTFGLNTYSRILSESKDQLQSVRTKGITGRILGSSEQYRDNYRLIDYMKFGSIPKEVTVQLADETFTTHFSFLQRRVTDKLIIEVSSYFKIKKEASFDELHQIIEEIELIQQLAPQDFLSSFKEIDDTDLISNVLYPELLNRLFKDIDIGASISHDYEVAFQHDFCNPNNFEMFYSADEYKLKERTENGGYSQFSTVSDRRDIYSRVMRRVKEIGADSSFEQFRTYIQGVRITCHRDGAMLPSSGCSFIFHISTEINLSKSYFYIDNRWYELRNSFVDELKFRCEEILKNNQLLKNIISEPWDRGRMIERDYNMKYDGREGYLVVDRTIVDHVELCDLMAFDESTLYLVHVKHGFNAKMRELTNQVLVSAKQLQVDLKQGKKQMLKKLYGRLRYSSEVQCHLDEEEFLKLFDLNIKYVLAFSSHLKNDESVIDNIDLYDSNIARFSVIQTSSDMRTNYFDLYFHQIRKAH